MTPRPRPHAHTHTHTHTDVLLSPARSPAPGEVSDWPDRLDRWVSQLEQLGHAAVDAAPRLAPAVAAVAAACCLTALVVRRRRRRRMAAGGRLVTVLPPPEVEPSGGQALWANLVALLRPWWRRTVGGQPHLSFEYVWDAGGLRIQLWVPAPVPPGLVEQAIEAAWPAARTRTTAVGPPLPADAAAAGGTLRLAAPDYYPLRADHDTDPLRALLGAASGLADDAACVQVLARPVTGRRLLRAHRAARALRAGQSVAPLGRLVDAVTPTPPGHGSGHGSTRTSGAAADPAAAGDIRAILDKAAHPQWEILVRYAAAAPGSAAGSPAGRHARDRLRGRAHALASAFALYAGRNHLDRHRLRHPLQALAGRRMGGGDLVSVPELAALAHLPTDPGVPGLARAGAKTVAPPPAIPSGGPDAKPLGDSDGPHPRPVALHAADARHHLHIVGPTGSGKTTLLLNLILADADAGRGAVVLDPQGDLVGELLHRLPAHRVEDTVVVDPDQPGPCPTLNALEGADPELAVENIVGIFRAIFEPHWGPRTDDTMRAACLTLQHHPGATLVDVPALLTDPQVRDYMLDPVHDPVLTGFWSWYDQLGDAGRAQVIAPVMNKLRAFLLRGFVRRVVGSARSTIDMGHVLDGGLLLCRLPKGALGEDAARLLGSFVVAKVWQAATQRARTDRAARADASLYMDEFHNFLNLPRSVSDILAEARGYRLSLVLAHQHLGQLPRDLRDAASANARNKIYFGLAPEDATVLAHHTEPELSAHDLAHLDVWHAAARLLVAGAETPAFTFGTRPEPPAVPGRARQVRAASAARYGATATRGDTRTA